ncbi:bifunctional adenosylcobinamide kinase/adenosylcobinamide-phosphate guanylyltransferase [Allonocardiopsis opalescens]|uniref:Adenosylcobinamide kinase /adenosylcobinamide-phosphate guanylyltransferase n=1 Tax=Allonocardiopsis opalescens TaxID=1144618 RepID=A0A2T0PZV7_9ACTN|nr:bifunctional adenosylcobinamide kinase/adenosylcobinamide-phosphate guanylyltransferase [Allonocardiopsis opalescens]PRX97068.1 adenosylcobinamide kinase /adenosylcobinamide-phosphate guanylyltransferase [Allonocardiopsis opalescens]
MDVELRGTGGAAGWPGADCRCASCNRAAAAGENRGPAHVLVDGRFEVPAPSLAGPVRGPLRDRHPVPAGYLLYRSADGVEVIGPDGSWVLYADQPPGGAAEGPADAADGPLGAVDIALVDPCGPAWVLARLRRRGRVGPATTVVAIGLDHRVASPAELVRRAWQWGVHVVDDGTVLRTRLDPVTLRALRPPIPPVPRPFGPYRVLVLGGALSRRSAEARQRLAAEPAVRYAPPPSRAEGAGAPPPGWRTVRPGGGDGTAPLGRLAALLRGAGDTLLVDDLGGWLADDAAADPGGTAGRIAELAEAWRFTAAHVVAVSTEVELADGSGPQAAELARLNRLLAEAAEEAVLVVAGRVVPLP